jgi:V/A-type H+-transporting ATPase subunit E
MAREHRAESVGGGTTPIRPQQSPAVESQGVESLIGRLRDEGIAQGRSQAEAIVGEAKKQAADIVAAAQRDADDILVKARQEAGKEKAAGEDAIRLAMRDTILSLEDEIINEFRNRLQRLVRGTLEESEFLQRLILAIAGKATPPVGERLELLLPSEIVSLEDLQRKPEEVKPGTLMHFVLTLGDGMLREGMSFGVADDIRAGIRVQFLDRDVQLDMTESAIRELMLKHMLPRFRALLRGAVAGTGAAEQPTAEQPKAEHPKAA